MSEKTIAAIATPTATGGISVIRISGDRAIETADNVFRAVSKKKLSEKKGYTASYGEIVYDGIKIDTSVALVYKSPHSYTGEDVVELSCHGGIYVTREVLRAVISSGAALAQPGEFTKRAFLNGKINLTQAEAISDIIVSNNKHATNVARAQYEGNLYRKINNIKQKLVEIAGHLAAWVDYPEEDIEIVSTEVLTSNLKEYQQELKTLLKNYDDGQLFKEGIDTAIIGKPNVGKSTLMNLLTGVEKSIVTDIAGTTRDIIEENIMCGDIVLRLSDTAGIRETEDIIEKYGVQMAEKKMTVASLILVVFDGSIALSSEDIRIIEHLGNTPVIGVINKSDLDCVIDIEYIKEHINTVVKISAKHDESIRDLETAIRKEIGIKDIDTSAPMIANERQRESANASLNYINESIDALECGVTLDAVTVSIEMAIESLMELTGEKITTEIVNNVFSHFCVGK